MTIKLKIATSVAALLIAAVPVVAYGRSGGTNGFSKSSIAGKWAWSNSGQLASRYKFAQIGIAAFDGKGGCTIALRENSGINGGYVHTSTECSYDVSKTGLGRADFSLDGEAGSIEFVIGPDRVAFMAPDEATVSMGELIPLGGTTGRAAAGDYSFSLDGTLYGERITGIGSMSLTPDGKCSQTLVYNYNTGPQRTKTESCTYSFAEDGIAEAAIAYDNGTGGDMYFVVGRGGRVFMLTKADGEVISGVAYRRR